MPWEGVVARCSGHLQWPGEGNMIVVFDGQCLLCNGWVQFLLRQDRRGRLRFASIQGEAGGRLLPDPQVAGRFLD